MKGERLKEIVRLLAQPGFRLIYDDHGQGGAICGPETTLLTEEVSFLSYHGWLKPMPSGTGACLSAAGYRSFIRSTDELKDGKLLNPDESTL